MRFINLFIKNNLIQLKRQWLALPLLLLFPIILIGLSIFLIAIYLLPSEENPLEIGLVDLDKSEETKVITEMLTSESAFNQLLKLTNLEEDEAKEAIQANKLSAYIIFPDDFVKSLYEGTSVEVKVVGNPKRKSESEITKELIDSVMRHINTSQANILLLNDRAKELNMLPEEKEEYLFEQFTSFLLYTTGKDKILSKEKITQHQTTSPIEYYAVAIWFIVLIIWLFIIYNFLYKGIPERLEIRIHLYGVTKFVQIIARLTVTLLTTFILSSGLFYILIKYFNILFLPEDYLRIFGLISLTSLIYLLVLALLEVLFKSDYIKLFSQIIVTFILISLSGALIPVIYFPVTIHSYLKYLPFNHSFHWLQEIIFNERFYAEFQLLLILVSVLFGLLAFIATWKERIRK